MSERVFRERGPDGLEFVGDFDGLYVEEVDPWNQSGCGTNAGYYAESRARLIEVLARHTTILSAGLEVGCGHGHALRCLSRRLGPDWAGLDVSAVAIEQARALHPDLVFMHGDICAMPEPLERHGYDVVVLNQVLWYIMDHLDATVANCCALLKDDGLLVLSQAFLREQRYGREVFDGWHGAVRRFTGYGHLQLVEARFDASRRHAFDDGLLAFNKRDVLP